MPGGQSRWSQGKDLSWEPLRPELVVEVAYDHMQGSRFRHIAQFRRWRSDKKPDRLHVRAARGCSAAGAIRDLRRIALSRTCAQRSCSSHSAFRCVRTPPLARRIVVRIGSFLRRAERLRHIPQIHSYARPGGRPSPHRIHQHIVYREVAGRLGMPALPSLQTRQSGRFVRRVRNHQ